MTGIEAIAGRYIKNARRYRQTLKKITWAKQNDFPSGAPQHPEIFANTVFILMV
jgi:hypothetical protein